MNQAVLCCPENTLSVPLVIAPRSCHNYLKVAEASGFQQLLRSDPNLESREIKSACPQVFGSVVRGAGSERCEEQFRRSHASIRAAVLDQLVANEGVLPGMDAEFYAIGVINRNIESHALTDAILRN